MMCVCEAIEHFACSSSPCEQLGTERRLRNHWDWDEYGFLLCLREDQESNVLCKV